MNQEKIDRTKRKIYEWFTPGKTALMCSFGKDSMVLLHLIRETLPINKLSVHAYPVPVIYHRQPWLAFKNEFADSVIRSWALSVHDYPPIAAGIKVNHEHLELVARYPFGNAGMDLPINTLEPIPRRAFVCGLIDWVMRPKTSLTRYPWDTVYIGHKSSDVDPFDGPIPLKADHANGGGVNMVFPLKDWSDEDVWNYIEENAIAYDKARYQNRTEVPDKWANPDYLHACTRCIDPRNDAKEVMCPKLDAMVANVGKQVLRLQQIPDYIAECGMRNAESKKPADVVTEASKYLFEKGIKILQGNRLGPDDEAHVSELAGYMQLNGERHVADMGCGFGEVSRLLTKNIPSAYFYLVNTNRFQMEQCPRGIFFAPHREDMCNTSIGDNSIDLTMFNFSFCHAYPADALREAARITREGGKLFIYDYERTGGDNDLTAQHLFARFIPDSVFRAFCEQLGWTDVETIYPGGDNTLFREAIGNDALYDAMFKDLKPVIWRARRVKEPSGSHAVKEKEN